MTVKITNNTIASVSLTPQQEAIEQAKALSQVNVASSAPQIIKTITLTNLKEIK